MADENTINGEVNQQINVNFESHGAEDVIESGKAVDSVLKSIGDTLAKNGFKVASRDLSVLGTILEKDASSMKLITADMGKFLNNIPKPHETLDKLVGGGRDVVKSMYTPLEAVKTAVARTRSEAFGELTKSAEAATTSASESFEEMAQDIQKAHDASIVREPFLKMSPKEVKEQKDRIKEGLSRIQNELERQADVLSKDGEAAGREFADGVAKGASNNGPPVSEILGTEDGKGYVKGVTDAIADSKANLKDTINTNWDMLSDKGRGRGFGAGFGLGEKLLDTSKISEYGASLSNEFSSITDDVTKQADAMTERLSKMYSRIPETVTHTPGGNIVNAASMDAKAAYANVDSLIKKLRELPSTLAVSSDMKSLEKQAEKYKQAWQDASDKRDAFVINTTSNAVKTYNNLQKQIDAQRNIRDAIEREVQYLQSKNVNENDSEFVQLNKDLRTAIRNINTLEKRQQSLLNNKAVAENKSTYDTYTQKMYDANAQLQRVMKEMEDLGYAGGLSNSADVLAEIKNITGQINSGFDDLRKKVSDADLESRKLGHSTDALNTKYRGLKPPKGMVKTDEFKNLEKQYRSAYKALQTLSDKQEKYLQNGTKVDSKAWKNLEIDIEQARQKLEEYDALLTKAQSEGTAFTTKKNFIDLRWSDVFGSGWGKAFGDALSSGLSSFKKTTSVTFGALKKMLMGIWGIVPKIGKGIKDWAKNQKSLGDSAKQMYKTFTGYLSMLRTRIRRKFISMVFEDLQNNIKALAKMSPRLNKVISDFIVSTKTLGAQIVAAFEPLVAKVLPYITMFVDYLTYAAQQMSQFISQLFGDDTWIKAVKGQYNFAESVDESTSSTKKATKAAKEYENTVLSFDELHKLNGNDSGSEEDADGLTGVDLKYAELEANKLMEIAKRIHDAISAGDFYGAGKAMGEGVNEAFAWLRDTAGWSKNAEKFTQWAENAGNLVNGIIDGINGVANGAAIGDIANSLINMIDVLVNPDSEAHIHFAEAGKKLGETFAAAIVEIDWKTAGDNLINGLQGLAQMVTGFLNADVWEAVDKETGKTRAVEIGDMGLPMFAGTDEVVDRNQWELQQVKGAEALGHGLQRMFSGAVESFDSGTWSDLLSSLVNNFFLFLESTFSDADKAAEFGRQIGQMINETVQKIDVEQVAGGINAFTNSLMGFFESAFDEVEWTDLFGKLKDLATLIDWTPIGIAVGLAMAPGLITGLISGAGSLVKTIGTAFIVSKILGLGGAGAAAGGASMGLSGFFTMCLAMFADVIGIAYGVASVIEALKMDIEYGIPAIIAADKETKSAWQEIKDANNGSTWESIKDVGKYLSNNLFGTDYAYNGNYAENTAGQAGEEMGEAMRTALNESTVALDPFSIESASPEWLRRGSEDPFTKHFGEDGEALFSGFTERVGEIMPAVDGSVLSSAPTEDFRNDFAKDVGAAFFDALTKTAGDVVMVVNGNEIGRVAMNYMAKYNKQYLATKPAVT